MRIQIISIHAPAWGATCPAARALLYSSIFQSTLPRGERLPADILQLFSHQISIHAPAWGATSLGRSYAKKSRNISIHAPAWGATEMNTRSFVPIPYFNPRSRVGSDNSKRIQFFGTSSFQSTLPRGERLKNIWDWLTSFWISIHAPAWGATSADVGK